MDLYILAVRSAVRALQTVQPVYHCAHEKWFFMCGSKVSIAVQTVSDAALLSVVFPIKGLIPLQHHSCYAFICYDIFFVPQRSAKPAVERFHCHRVCMRIKPVYSAASQKYGNRNTMKAKCIRLNEVHIFNYTRSRHHFSIQSA